MKRFFLFLTVFCLLCTALAAPAAAVARHSWYCMRNKEHKQPAPPAELRFAEEYDAYYVDHAHGDEDPDKVVYLTFDAGYENGNVEKVLNALDREDVKGAFFILSHLVTANTELVNRMFEGGHTVCNHTAHHPDLSCADRDKIKRELEELDRVCLEKTGREPARYFRPPEGAFSAEMLAAVRDLGYKTVFWSFAYADWDNAKQPDPEKALALILANVHNGAVLLLHPTSATNAAILPRLIETLKAEGYRFGTMEELCGA